MSCSRRCDYWKATDGKWYCRLGNFEHAEEEQDCTCYGPRDTIEEICEFIGNGFSNPGSSWEDDSGKSPPPEKCQPARPRSRESIYIRPRHRFC